VSLAGASALLLAASAAARPDASDAPQLRLGLAAIAARQAATEPASKPVAPPPADRPLDLETAVRIALDTNPLMRAAREGVSAAAEAIGVARAVYYPEVGLDARYRRFDTHIFLPPGLPVSATTLGATDDWSAGVRAGYTLYDSGQRRAERDVAVASERAAAHDAAKVRQDVVFGVHQAYFRVLSALAASSAAEARLARSRDHLELARTRKAAGAAPQSDVLRAQVEVADAQLALVRTDGEVRVAYGELNTAMGLPVDLGISVTPVDETASQPATAVGVALERALQQRPELKAARQRIAAASREVAAIKGAYGLRLRADGMLGWRDSEFLPEDQDWSAGVSFQLPLFTGFARAHRVAQASTGVQVLEAETAALAARIQQEVWAAASSLEEARQSVAQSEVLRSEAAESLRFARARYEAGAATITDLLDAESRLTQAVASHVAAVFGYHLAMSRLLRAQGEM